MPSVILCDRIRRSRAQRLLQAANHHLLKSSAFYDDGVTLLSRIHLVPAFCTRFSTASVEKYLSKTRKPTMPNRCDYVLLWNTYLADRRSDTVRLVLGELLTGRHILRCRSVLISVRDFKKRLATKLEAQQTYASSLMCEVFRFLVQRGARFKAKRASDRQNASKLSKSRSMPSKSDGFWM